MNDDFYRIPDRAHTIRQEFRTAHRHFTNGLKLLADVTEFSEKEQAATGEFLFTAYQYFHNKLFTGAIAYLAQQKHVQRQVKMRNEWEILTELAGIERSQVKGVLNSSTLVDNTNTLAHQFAELAEALPADDAEEPPIADYFEGGTGEPVLFGNAAHHNDTDAPEATGTDVSDSAGDTTGGGSGLPSVDQPLTEAELEGMRQSQASLTADNTKKQQKYRAKDKARRELIASNPYLAAVQARINELLVAYADDLTEAGVAKKRAVGQQLWRIAEDHTDISSYNAAAVQYLKETFPNRRPSTQYIADNRGITFKANDQRTGFFLGGFITNADCTLIRNLIATNRHVMDTTRNNNLRAIAKEHAENNLHTDGDLCPACTLVDLADSNDKAREFRSSSAKERDLDALIYTLLSGAGEQQTIAVESFLIPELAYIDDAGHLQTGSAVKFINFDEALGFKPNRKIAVGCDARTGQPLVAGWIDPTLNANRAIGTLTKGMVFSQHSTCCGEGCDEPFENCELHHIVPFAYDGPTVEANLIPLCKKCHMRMRYLAESNGGVFYYKLDDGTIMAEDKNGTREITQTTNSWVKHHIQQGLPIPVILTTSPLPLKDHITQEGHDHAVQQPEQPTEETSAATSAEAV